MERVMVIVIVAVMEVVMAIVVVLVVVVVGEELAIRSFGIVPIAAVQTTVLRAAD